MLPCDFGLRERYMKLEAVYPRLKFLEQSEWCREVIARGDAKAARLNLQEKRTQT